MGFRVWCRGERVSLEVDTTNETETLEKKKAAEGDFGGSRPEGELRPGDHPELQEAGGGGQASTGSLVKAKARKIDELAAQYGAALNEALQRGDITPAQWHASMGGTF